MAAEDADRPMVTLRAIRAWETCSKAENIPVVCVQLRTGEPFVSHLPQ